MAVARLPGPVLAFVAITYGLSILMSLVVGFTGGPESPFVWLGFVAMLIPALAVLILRGAAGERVDSMGWDRFPLVYLPISLLLIPVVMHVAMVPLVAFLEGEMPWQDWLTRGADGLYHSPESRGWGALSVDQLAGRIALNAGVGILVVTVLAFFEELGWRAWLLPRLVRQFGARRAIVTGAAIWAFWHTPFALSGVHFLEDVSTATTAAILPIGHMGAGLVIGWLWLRTESIWMVSLAHGALNNWGQYVFKFMEGFGEHDAALLLSGSVALLFTGSLLVRCCVEANPSRGTSPERLPFPRPHLDDGPVAQRDPREDLNVEGP